jgi:hypothetical protein
MASVPKGLVFKMILSPWAAMSTACASVAHGVMVGLRVQAVSSHKTKQKKPKKLKTMNDGKKKTKTDSNKSTAFGKRLLFFVVNVNSID